MPEYDTHSRLPSAHINRVIVSSMSFGVCIRATRDREGTDQL